MSTLAYAILTRRRVNAALAATKGVADSPDVSRYVDTLAALVPAEVLSAHAAILTFTTDTLANASGQITVVITDPRTLVGSFWALIAVSMVLYGVGRSKDSTWNR